VGVAWLIGVTTHPAPSSDVAEELGRALEKPKLAQNLATIAKALGRPIDAANLLDRARVARNEIVHDLSVGVVSDVETDAGRSALLQDLREDVRRVAEADIVVCLLSQVLQGAKLPPVKFVGAYPSRIVDWVCDVEDVFAS